MLHCQKKGGFIKVAVLWETVINGVRKTDGNLFNCCVFEVVLHFLVFFKNHAMNFEAFIKIK